jgi:hypothetical protein
MWYASAVILPLVNVIFAPKLCRFLFRSGITKQSLYKQWGSHQSLSLITEGLLFRVGRTARGNNKGTALSLVAIKENERAAAVEADLKERQGSDDVFKPFQFKMEELDGFR